MADFFKKSNTIDNGAPQASRKTVATQAVNEALQMLTDKYQKQLPSTTIAEQVDFKEPALPTPQN